MRYLILRTNVSDFGKVGTYNVQEVGLAEALRRRGHEAKVVYLHKKVDSVETDDLYNFVFYLPSKRLGLHGFFNLRLLDYFDFDAIIYFSDNQLFSRKLIKWANTNDKNLIIYWGAVLSTTPKLLNKTYTFLILMLNWLSYRKTINIAKTHEVKKGLEKFYIKCSGVINVGLDTTVLDKSEIDHNSLKEAHGFTPSDKIILFVGRLEEAKRPQLALQIIEKIVSYRDNTKLLIIGKGTKLDRLIEYSKKTGIEDSVRIINGIKYKDMHAYYKISNVMINLSSVEIFGMAMLEAMYYGVPVIAMEAPGPKEFIIDGYSGFLLNTLDSLKWAKKIIDVLDNDIQEIICNARQMIDHRFTWDKTSNMFIEVFKNEVDL